MIRVFAPGKVVVAGEYAVLDGAPAIVAAVDIGVEARFEPDPDAGRVLRTPRGDDRFVRAALEAVDAPAGTWTFLDVGGPPMPSKPGLGGSAAATVAAVAAGLAARGRAVDRTEVHTIAAAVHHRVQGSGSGIDVAASTWGGLLRFQLGREPVVLTPFPLAVVWSGRSASTGPRVERYLAWPDRHAFVRASTELVDRFASDPAGALRANGTLLRGMAAAAGVAWATPELDAIVDLAEAVGGAAKPSGAGGGDCAVAILPGTTAEQTFVASCGRLGFTVLSTRLAPGVTLLPG